MKKILMYTLQLLSLFLFFVLVMGFVGLVKDVAQNKEGMAYGFGYGLGGILVLALFFWLNVRLWKFSNKYNEK